MWVTTVLVLIDSQRVHSFYSGDQSVDHLGGHLRTTETEYVLVGVLQDLLFRQ